MENDILLQKELASVKADKKLSEEELVKHKSSMAEQIMLQMQGMTKNDIYELSVPVKRKKPMKVKYRNFSNRIKTIIGIGNENR